MALTRVIQRLPGPVTGLSYGLALGMFIAGGIVYAAADSHDQHLGSAFGVLGGLFSLVAMFIGTFERERRTPANSPPEDP